ncbi:AIPR family protein [Paraliomyxa miuraensis]|uniref:AIPR family protein n=1 Tax=Paraliomyxa miuraensis TaxID=376150 RepID=UPI0022504E37|nr:AIPR family protein [Paraliomyxa miuraensis]MCX4240673.1 AIPR family protein [Paraliomyxa miuraensis]
MATDLDAGIIDQRVRGLVETYGARLAQRGKDDPARRASNAFCALCVATLLDLELDEAVATLTDGGEDGGVDAIHVASLRDDQPLVTLFQAKYEQKTLAGRSGFPAAEIPKLIETIRTIFDPDKPLSKMKDIEAVVEEIRSRMREGAIPTIRVVLCNNGPRWGPDGDARIEAAGFPVDEVQWLHLDHRRLVSLFRSQKSIDAILDFHGAAHHEDLSFRRVFVGKVPVTTIAELMSTHGDLLLDRNIRRFLGPSNRVNSRIAQTLRSPEERQNFYFYNNGLTMICRRLSFSSLRQNNYQVKVEGLQIINGGQTCKTIQQVLGEPTQQEPSEAPNRVSFDDTFVMVRLYQLGEDDGHLGHAITYATNNQTPVELQDLRANDELQQRLALDLAELGYTYKTKRDNHPASETTITSKQAAIAVLTIWRRQPHLARFAESRLFDHYYPRIFTKKLNGAQVVLATRIFADVEQMLERSSEPKPFVPYATHYVAMACGVQLLMGHTGNPLAENPDIIDHRSLPSLLEAGRARRRSWSEVRSCSSS